MDYYTRAVEYRKELHKIPEVGMKEFKTTEYILNALKVMGYEVEAALETGAIAYKKGTDESSSIAFRADIDALAIQEETVGETKSEHEGYMHGCGHDYHIAVLLGFAEYLKDVETSCNIVFIFQPAEESPGGARPIVESGKLDRFNITEIYGLHIWPYLDQGKIGVKPGPLMAMSGEFELDLIGKGGHGAVPNSAIDPIFISSQVISSLQSIVSRNIEPIDDAVVTVGYIRGGSVHNVIPGKVEMGGTIRAFRQEVYDRIKERIATICEGIAKAYEMEIEVRITDFYKPVDNDEKLTEEFIKSQGNVVEIVKPYMTGEDFSFYQAEYPGVFFFLGSKNEEKGFIQPLHNSRFQADDQVIKNGIDSYINLLKYKSVIE
ncbi:hippurate hydrolase [Dethiosulfatibacter aminovorans DSM 17477]|uniref:Hippurate hydrolase n=1 Tax=Dethiosulfatibacter aminovorans DSM 17477 TaxID=1121476 RepID=A0A1M6H5A2_9FIRM|nr:amidohydrolase [Dethiosulfatibacter aminovorans]SHJ17370.1 hippurate hydrolase [Dethiosulfatibacter aminovorans DSM 17477]